MDYETVYFVAYARLPRDIPASEQFVRVAIGAEILVSTGMVLNVSCTLPSQLARDFVSGYLLKKNIVNDLDEIVGEINYRHQGDVQKAIIKTVVEINKKYLAFVAKHKIKTTF
jgi:formate dehydrogenase assembly factor FdhD